MVVLVKTDAKNSEDIAKNSTRFSASSPDIFCIKSLYSKLSAKNIRKGWSGMTNLVSNNDSVIISKDYCKKIICNFLLLGEHF